MRRSHKPLSTWFRAISVVLLCAGCSNSEPVDKIISVEDDDAEMNTAISNARRTLPEFWKEFENLSAGETDFALKLPITDANGTEHFWLTSIEKRDGQIFGTINNDPNTVKSVHNGQRIEILEAQVSDWMYMRNGKIVGNYTLRPLMKRMSPEELEQVKSLLAEP
jgi:uncharacterized protein YegJ (DUF2314 family)